PTPASRFERKQDEPVKTNENSETSTAFAPSVSSLAEHKNEEEQEEMSNRQSTAVIEPEDELEFVTAEEHAAMNTNSSAPVVPLAFTHTLKTLRQPIEPKFIKTREGWRDRNGNTHMVEYVEWHTVADLLDRVAPTWSHSVRGIVQIGDMVAVTAAISIDGVTREGVGTGTADNETGIKKAEHDALKRAAIKFGIARELYQRESEVIEQTGSVPQSEFPRDPLAKSMSDLVTPKQLGMIRALAREAGVDVEEECQAVLRCRTEELSKKAASSFIDHLKNSQQQQGEQQQQPMRRAS
ncbi:MAG: RAD52 family DNA repair protein, partial [Acidobacteria bacterium]|nr:RAD52 family DNA repair protein [Acidobacteriota bacterium]